MFQKLKQFKEMRGRAKNIQSMMSEISVESQSHGISIVMDGNQRVLSVKIESHLNAASLEKHLPGVINDAVKKSQHEMVKHMQAHGGMDNFKL